MSPGSSGGRRSGTQIKESLAPTRVSMCSEDSREEVYLSASGFSLPKIRSEPLELYVTTSLAREIFTTWGSHC
jgi:hypothetical protein